MVANEVRVWNIEDPGRRVETLPARRCVNIQPVVAGTARQSTAPVVPGFEPAGLNREPDASTLRCLQNLIEIGAEKNRTLVSPLPFEVLGGLRATLRT